MKSLDTLLKVAQRRLDDLGVEAANLQTRIDAMHQEEARLDAREAAEAGAAARDPMLAGMLSAFRARMKIARHEIRGRISEAEKTMELVRERLATAYQEKSKFREMLDQSNQREETARLTREQAQLDEAALNLSIRNR
jgi:flagellar export protein FliJ